MMMMMMMMMSWIVSDLHVVPISAFPKFTNARFGTGTDIQCFEVFPGHENQCNGHDRSETRQGTAGQGKTRQNAAGQGKTRQNAAGHGKTEHGRAGQGRAGHSTRGKNSQKY